MPDSNPRYEKIPRKESIDKFVEGMKRHDCVSEVEKVSDIYYRITKTTGEILNVLLTNIYIVSEANVYEYLNSEEYKDINVILTMSVWNSYTLDATKMAKDRKVALFTYKEFYGALNYDGDKFLNYRVKKRNQ